MSAVNLKMIKDVLDPDHLQSVVNVVFDQKTPWAYSQDTVYGKENQNPYGFGWSHMVYSEGAPVSPLYALFVPVLIRICQKAHINTNSLLRMRLGLLTRTAETICHSPHIDVSVDHKVILFYLNSSDGDTILYKKRTTPNSPFEIEKRITPTENMAVLFDGSVFHSSSTPVEKDRRIVLNINYV